MELSKGLKMQINTFQTWLNEKYSDSNVKVFYVEVKVGRKVKKVPVFEEKVVIPINLKRLLHSYISAKTKDTEFSDLSLGVRFAIVQSFTQTKIYIWPQQFLHKAIIPIIDIELGKLYDDIMADSVKTDTAMFMGTLLVNSEKIQTNMSKSAFMVVTKNRVNEFLSQFDLTPKDLEFYK